jgi:hypothetical protein
VTDAATGLAKAGQSVPMPLYDCRFIDHGDNVYSRASFHADHDDAAVDYARTVYHHGIGKGFELWQGDRLIHRHVRAGRQ